MITVIRFLALLAAESVIAIAVHSSAGVINGKVDKKTQVTGYLSIPFAEPPVGNLRWKPPVKKSPWAGTLDGTKFPSPCPQPFVSPYNEDCLYLNVFVPKTANGKPPKAGQFPVMIFIHGGAFLLGSTRAYPAWSLAKTGAAIVVTVQYRLGPLGFLVIPELQQEQGKNALNYGLRDQMLALDWVKQHIASFGGDTKRVLLFGESAGAASVAFHLTTNLKSPPMYTAAAMESPGPSHYWNVSRSSEAGDQLATVVGCPASKNGYASRLACLRKVALSQLFFSFILSGPSLNNLVMLPTVDGNLIPNQPVTMFKAGRFHRDVPVLIGNNEFEGRLFEVLDQKVDALKDTLTEQQYNKLTKKFVQSMDKKDSVSVIDALLAVYNHSSFNPLNPPNLNKRLSKVIADGVITCLTQVIGDSTVEFSSKPTYRYLFSGVVAESKYGYLGPTHAAELSFVFNDANVPIHKGAPLKLNSTNSQLAVAMATSWAGMAADGNPNKSPFHRQWPKYDGEGTNTILHFKTAPITLSNISYPCTDWVPILESP